MDRRTFLKAAAAFAAAPIIARPADAETLFPLPSGEAALTVDSSRQGAKIPPDFLGFSYESSELGDPDFFTPENRGLLALIRRLGPEGVIRIGGNSSEFTRRQSEGGASRREKQTVVTPDAIERLGAFVQASGWKLIYGLNLGRGTPEQAAWEAAAVAQAAGDRLIAFQIGNEPDLFSGRHADLRPATYTYEDYLGEWQTFAQAVEAAVPNARFAGPDTAGGPAWVAQFGQDVPDAVLLSQHYYAEGPAGSKSVTIKRLLNSTSRLAGTLEAFQRAALDAGRPFRMTEMNSCYGGGQSGVSDTFASALWGVTALFQILDSGCAGVNFHGGPRGAYTPIAQAKRFEAAARPLYHAMLFFAQAGPGHLIAARLTGTPHSVAAYAIKHGDGGLTLALVNANATRSFHITVDPGDAFTGGTILRLTGPSLDAKKGIAFGGAEVGKDGTWEATANESVVFQDHGFMLDFPAASAACVHLTAETRD